MPRRFPGIDPYIESQNFWRGFPSAAMTYCRDAIANQLPDAYDFWIEERIQLVEDPGKTGKQMIPDLVVDRASGFFDIVRRPAVLEVGPTILAVTLLDDVRESYLQILHRPDQTLVTVIEWLSPDNKTGAGSVQYLAKRNALLHQPVHLVELDLLVGGLRLPMDQPLPLGDAYAFVARGDRRPDCEVDAWSIRQALKTIRIPLLAPDPDSPLDLATVYATTFEKGRYARSIDDNAPLTIGLAPDDQAWAVARAKGHDA